MKNTTWLSAMILGTTSVCLAGGPPSSDFDDGTLQGWTPQAPYDGQLIWVDAGNPGGAMQAIDEASGGLLLARAPEAYSGDFTIFSSITWDEFLPAGAFFSTTRIVLEGPDGTRWQSPAIGIEEQVWRAREQSFEPAGWTLLAGAASYASVRGNVVAMYVNMEASGIGDEGRVDNIALQVGPCPADLNDSGAVDAGDLAVLLAAWGPGGGVAADLNFDGVVNAGDLATLLAAWGDCDGGAVCGNGICEPGEDETNCPADCAIIDPPANDLCADAIAIGIGSTDYTTIGALTDGADHSDEGCQFDGQTYQDVWFDFTAPASGLLTVSTCNDANYDTDLVVYAGCDCKSLTFLGCSDDGCGLFSQLTVNVTEGECYKIRVGGWNPGSAGDGRVTLTLGAPVCDNGVCEPGENAENCPGDCPGTSTCGAGAGSCGEANGTPGCDDVACCETVCGFDPFCCDTAWDELCVDVAAKNCDG